MGKAKLKFSNSTNPEYLVITWALFSNPNAEIGRQAYAPPHNSQRELLVENLAPVVHRFSFYRSSDGVTLGTRILYIDMDCGIDDAELLLYDYVVNRGEGSSVPGESWNDPISGESTVTDERLIGNDFIIKRRMLGELRPDEYTKDTNTGEWDISPLTFEDEDTWFAIVTKNFRNTSSYQPSSDYTDVHTVSASGSFSSSMYRKLVDISSAETVTTISFASLATIPVTRVIFSTHGMAGRYAKLAFTPGDTVKLLGRSLQDIYLRKGETIELMFTGTACHVLKYDGGLSNVGRITYGRGIEDNVISLDGSLLNISDYPGLYYDFVNRLPSNQVMTMAQWSATQLVSIIGLVYVNKGFFAVDSVAQQFRVPDMRNMFVRSLKLDVSADGTRFTDLPGGYQLDGVGNFTAIMNVRKGYSYTGSTNNKVIGNGHDNAGTQNIDLYSASFNTGNSETTTKNIGLIPQIFI